MKHRWITLLLMLCLFVGIMMVFINPLQEYLVSDLSEELTTITYTVEQLESNQVIEAEYDFEAVQSLTIWDVLKAQVNVKDIPVIGSIHIPSVELTLPIIKGVGKDALTTGAGTMKPDQQMGQGNYALASHYIEGKDILFGPLYDLSEGEIIYVTDKRYVYEYETTDIKVIEATDVYIIEDIPDESLITLITCAEKGRKRLSVQGKLISKQLAG